MRRLCLAPLIALACTASKGAEVETPEPLPTVDLDWETGQEAREALLEVCVSPDGPADKDFARTVLNIGVTNEGAVAGVNVVKDEVGESGWLRCIQSQVMDWRFSPPSQNVVATVAVNYSARGPSAAIEVPDEGVFHLHSRKAAKAQIRYNMGVLKRCYDSSLEKDPGLAGRYSIKVFVSSDGRVYKVRIDDDTLHSLELAQCVTRLVGEWRLPPDAQGEAGTLTFSVVFENAAPPAGAGERAVKSRVKSKLETPPT